MSSVGDPLFLFEIILDQCGLTNGVAPCTATTPCDNTWHTCPSKCDYVCEPISYWFSNCQVPGHLGVYDALPIIDEWDHKPSKLVPGSMFNGKGSIRICMQDLDACDGLGGFVLARLIEAQKYLEGRRMNVWQGDCNMSFDEMVKSTFFIDRVDGPRKDCSVCFEGSDPTSLIGFDKAVCPPRKRLADVIYGEPVPLSLGVELQGIATQSEPKNSPDVLIDTFVLANNYLPDNDGPIDQCFLDTKYVCAGKEMLRVVPCINEDANPVPGWNFKLAERGVCDSPVVSHKNGARIEIVKHFENQHAADVIRCLMQECANLDQVGAACCDDVESFLSEYYLEEYRCKRPSDMIADVKLCEVEDVGELLECMAKELNISIFFDDFCQQMVVRPYCPPSPDDEVKIITASDVIKDSFQVKSTDERYSSVTFNHDVVDCVLGARSGNYRCAVVNQNIDALREPCDRRTYKTDRDLVINSKWVNGGNAYLANVNTIRWAERAVCPPREVQLDTIPSISRCWAMGDIGQIQHEKLSSNGQFNDALWMFTGRKMLDDCVRLCFIETPWSAGKYINSFNCEQIIEPRPTDLCALEECVSAW